MRNLSSIFERVRLDEDFLRIMILRGQGTEITLENISTPPRIEKYAPDREVSPKSGEAELLALGWRLVPVPWLSVEGGLRLSWSCPSCWLVMPPSDAPAQRFDSRRAALWYAQEQAGLRQTKPGDEALMEGGAS